MPARDPPADTGADDLSELVTQDAESAPDRLEVVGCVIPCWISGAGPPRKPATGSRSQGFGWLWVSPIDAFEMPGASGQVQHTPRPMIENVPPSAAGGETVSTTSSLVIIA